MKISQLTNVIQKFTDPREAPADAARDSAAVRPQQAESRAEKIQPEQKSADGDEIRLSPQAVFLFAASQYDPRNISQNETRELAQTLREGRAISERDEIVLTRPNRDRSRLFFTDPEPTARRDLIVEFQSRLAQDTTRGDIANVEADTRALSILGRLAIVRDELLNTET